MTSLQVFDARLAKIGQGAGALERLCGGAAWSEGPVWLPQSSELIWSDIPNNRILSWHAQLGLRVWRDDSEFTNGHVLDQGGDLLHASHGQRAIIRTRLGSQGEPQCDEVVVDNYRGQRLNSPNDLVVKSDGTIWFTDPPYGILSDREGHKATSEIGANHVYRYCPQTQNLSIASDWLEEPNGLAFSPDERVLYVSDTSAALREDGTGHHHIVALEVVDGTWLRDPRIFAVVTPGLADGFRVDIHGFVYTSSGDSVQIYHPDGTRLGRIPVPEKVGNLCFGGPGGGDLFICASTSLYRIKINTRGATA
ncbi:SMP-30/gluconolactonase/LRE family protein [Limnohabitans sp. T6-20]|uniref:SMP-30/gluconolactonase/LRE family protein n=1 Tax=Limnohabitans sp. T6-20 TaxID=1100725 RepID=UPI000D3B8332|nr:SMP-30/gluconolactonase/LRE family protein [Limnohabitans sp. T6-20]PUE07549.1 gluconolactonase [Limnohabitans sp. T6-20]